MSKLDTLLEGLGRQDLGENYGRHAQIVQEGLSGQVAEADGKAVFQWDDAIDRAESHLESLKKIVKGKKENHLRHIDAQKMLSALRQIGADLRYMVQDLDKHDKLYKGR